MTDVVDFVNQIAAAQSADAKETLNNILSQKAMNALDDKKQDLAKNMFSGVEAQPEGEEHPVEEPTEGETEVEVQDSADAPIEEPTEEQPQEDE